MLIKYQAGESYPDLANEYQMTVDAVRGRVRRAREYDPTPQRVKPIIAASSMPVYNTPLKAQGDAVLLFDTEFPYHNADFLNRVLDLADAWNIRRLILGGDVAHFDSFSHWEANWTAPKQPGDSLTAETMAALKVQAANNPDLLKILETIPVDEPGNDELAELRRNLETLGTCFDDILFTLGNHDARFLHALNSPLLPRKLLDFIGGCPEPKWKISPYYYSILETEGETYRVEHPKSAAQTTAVKLADKYECSVIVGHSHLQSTGWSTSGNHYAIAAGCVVDEGRLPYAAQRSTNRPAHSLGAVIVRDGVPWTLHARSDWTRLRRLV